MSYWNPLPSARDLVGRRERGPWFEGVWAERNPRNVPGPFYGASTDTCWTGRLEAPHNVLYDENGREFVYRQPGTAAEVSAVLSAAESEAFCGYAADGDLHWTPDLVRGWWGERAGLREWIDTRIPLAEELQDVAGALRDFRQSLDGELEGRLRAYVFWLVERRTPREGEALPEL
ncbi:hypothetical protein [Amycolatopsis sp. H20-H5]|uniref:hypothetical protein n=1 Tax=Amycolatopsis sp. H20-H5 TaxID=3046309 RepID=UPI002DBA34E1|nr:hypothetical protein [Amycolatopsis sp. H20-H5]MEC3979412.1 hypothetical protein [Amycolatopsis sp. H20-H5]